MKRTIRELSLILFFTYFGLSCPLPLGAQQAPDNENGLDVVLLVDRSGSMSGPENALALAAAQFIADQAFFFKQDVSLVVIPFADEPRPLPENGFFQDAGAALGAIGGLARPSGWTDMEGALIMTQKRLVPFDGKRRKMALMITDGRPEPNPTNAAGNPDVASRVNQHCGKFTRNSAEYKQCVEPFVNELSAASQEKILETLLPAFGHDLPIYSIALESASINKDFLESCAVISTGRSDAFRVVGRNNLIEAANALFPKGDEAITLYEKHIGAGTQRTLEDEFPLPLSLKRVRVVLNYLEQKVQEQDMDLEVQLPDGQILKKGGDGFDYIIAKTQEKRPSVVFERLILPTPVPYGKGKLILRGSSKRGAPPKTFVVIEGVIAEGSLVIALEPGEPQAGARLRINARLEDNGRIVGVEEMAGTVYGPEGRAVSVKLNKGQNGSFEGEYPLPASARGRHLLSVKAVIDRSLGQSVSAEKEFQVIAPEPARLRIEIPFSTLVPTSLQMRDERFAAMIGRLLFPREADAAVRFGESKSPEAIIFSHLGCEETSFGIKNIRVINESATPAAIRLNLKPLTNAEGEVLDHKSWLSISPSATGKAVSGAPFEFSIVAKVPKKIPGNISNGTYKGSLVIESPDAAPITIPLELPIEIPSFSGLPEVLKTSVWWRIPASKHLAINLSTEEPCRIKGKIICTQNFQDKDENYLDPKKLRIVAPSPAFELEEGSKRKVPLTLSIGKLKAGQYTGSIYIDGDITRDSILPVLVTIPKPWFNPWPYEGPGYRGNLLQLAHIIGIALVALGVVTWATRARFRRYRPGGDSGTWQGNINEPLTERYPLDDQALFELRVAGGEGGWVLSPLSGAPVTVNGQDAPGAPAVRQGDHIGCRGLLFAMRDLTETQAVMAILQGPFPDAFFDRPRRLLQLGFVFLIVGQTATWFL